MTETNLKSLTPELEKLLNLKIDPHGFNPMVNALFVGIDFLKEKRRQPNFYQKTPDGEKIAINPNDYFGVVYQGKDGEVFFGYGRKDLIDRRIPNFQHREYSILFIFQGVSFPAFQEAENRYKFRKDVDEVQRYLSYGFTSFRLCPEKNKSVY
jgi:hypothetical protein